MARPTYTEQFRAQAVALAIEFGQSEAARLVDVPKGTIGCWCSRAGVKTLATEKTLGAVAATKANAEERRTRLADLLLQIAELSAEHAVPLIPEATLHQLVGAWDYAIKNSQLLSGGATARTEHAVEPTHAIVDELAARRHRAA